jgi:hypothetical protein
MKYGRIHTLVIFEGRKYTFFPQIFAKTFATPKSSVLQLSKKEQVVTQK